MTHIDWRRPNGENLIWCISEVSQDLCRLIRPLRNLYLYGVPERIPPIWRVLEEFYIGLETGFQCAGRSFVWLQVGGHRKYSTGNREDEIQNDVGTGLGVGGWKRGMSVVWPWNREWDSTIRQRDLSGKVWRRRSVSPCGGSLGLSFGEEGTSLYNWGEPYRETEMNLWDGSEVKMRVGEYRPTLLMSWVVSTEYTWSRCTHSFLDT